MNDLISASSASVTMTSLELVDFINGQRGQHEAELQHKHFLAKVPVVLGEQTSAKFSADLPDSYGRPRQGYKFPKREACLMAMSYSYDLQAKVFDRMTALEQQAVVAAFNLPTTYAGAMRLAADMVDQRDQAHSALAIAAPKVAALDLIATRAEGSVCITNAAKDLQVQPKRLFNWLQEHEWIYRRAGGSGFVAHQPRLKTGYLEHKITTIERSDGSSRMVEQVLVTAKGLARLAGEFGCVGGVQ